MEAHPRDPGEDLARGAPAVLAPLVREVLLRVVVLDEPVVRFREVRPALGPFEVPVGHAPLDAEGRLRIVLPAHAHAVPPPAYSGARPRGKKNATPADLRPVRDGSGGYSGTANAGRSSHRGDGHASQGS